MEIDEFLDLQFDLDEQQEEFYGQQDALVARPVQKQMQSVHNLERSAGPPTTSKRPLDEINLNAGANTHLKF